ncbi:MAG: beta-galactosidase [Clostridia bacterium]|nr:beta-galactosidase [Clostridia bacterium]
MHRMHRIGKIEPKTAAEVASSRLGIGFEKLDRDAFDPEKAYDKLSRIGVKWVRIQSGWQKTEREKGVYDFSWLDKIVDNIIARGMQPWMCVCYGNALYGGMATEVFGAVGCPPIHTEEQRAAWRNYCVALGKHFRGRVTRMEIWNEADATPTWKHGANATEYGEFVIATSKALRVGNPDLYIVAGAMAKIRMRYLCEAFETGMAKHIHAVSFHAYLFDDRRLSGDIKALRAAIDRYDSKIEIIQGESGSQSSPFGHGAMYEGAWSPRKQCKQQLRHLVTDLGMGVRLTSYFSCMDMMEALNGRVGDQASYKDFGYFGVLGAEFDENGIATGAYPEKPSYYTLQNLASLFAGDIRVTDLPITVEVENAPHCGNIPSVSYGEIEDYGFRLDNGAYLYAYWIPSSLMTAETESAVSFSVGGMGMPHLIDPMDGSIYEIFAPMMEADAFGGVELHLLPIRDYPLFLLFGDVR